MLPPATHTKPAAACSSHTMKNTRKEVYHMLESIAILREIFREQREHEEGLMFRNPSVPFWYNWLIAGLIVALFVSFVIWGIDIHTRHRAEEMTATALASWQQEQTVQDEQARSSQEYVLDQEATAVAKAFYGIDKFVEIYKYDDSDLETYARCMFNRAESGDLIRVISEPNQFTGYSDSNQVLANYKQLALRLVTEWHEETVKPCNTNFLFAELTPDGIFLKQDLRAGPYDRRWHA